jgi:Fe-S-cluster-containing dehydrogenase component
MSAELRFWKSAGELRANANANASGGARDCFAGQRALTGEPPAASRRDFLTIAGFSVAAAAISACSRGRVQKAIPFVTQPEEMTPGVPNYYATTCGGCMAACSLLVKTRDGRPIKIEGNGESPVFGGGTCAVGQATVLSLYDEDRLRGPLWHSRPVSWQEIDAVIGDRLTDAAAARCRVVLLSRSNRGPATAHLIDEWTSRPGFTHVTYDAIPAAGLRRATKAAFGVDGLPHYRFAEARTIVAIEADFLGTWLSPVEFTRDYATRRRPEGPRPMSRHIHFESGVSLTGSNADTRISIAPSERGLVALGLFHRIAERAGTVDLPALPSALPHAAALDAAAASLWDSRGESLVVTGADDEATQLLVHAMNALLGSVGTTVDLGRPSRQREGDETAVTRLVEDMASGEIDVLLLYGVNPAYDHPSADRFVAAMAKVPLVVSFSDRLDETSSRAHAVCPDHHFLEAWGDAEPIASYHSLGQPTIAPLFDTRAAQESLLTWLGRPANFYDYLRAYWREAVYPKQQRHATFDEFWDRSLHDGVFSAPAAAAATRFEGDWRSAWEAVRGDHERLSAPHAADRFELHLYETVGLRDGAHANNPWLQELPDPVTKVTWGNYASIAPAAAARLGIADGDVVTVDAAGTRIELPAHVQPGQSATTISIALGYGRTRAGRVGTHVGANAYPFVQAVAGGRRYFRTGVTIAPTGRRDELAATQTHHSMEGRDIVRQVTLASFLQPKASGHDAAAEAETSLWTERPAGAHSWGMAVDLNACTGCSACVTACQAENNVPVVGKDEVRRGREMHWIRLDRYYAGSEDAPETLVQPMMCQHCGNAPCEPVCPVLATVHSSDGINQQVYNRCVGTRYCENNCPYKVRRFNWFEYARNDRFDFNMNSPLGAMVLNPDVVVRSRGVMEKCSLCTQRIQAGKLEAEREGRPVADGDIQTACQQVCPADAIVFGDLDDPKSRVSTLVTSRRRYRVLEEIGTRPHVSYLTKVKNA